MTNSTRLEVLEKSEKILLEERDILREERNAATIELTKVQKMLREKEEKTEKLSLEFSLVASKEKEYFTSWQQEKSNREKAEKSTRDAEKSLSQLQQEHKYLNDTCREQQDRLRSLKKQTQQFQETSIADYEVISGLEKQVDQLKAQISKLQNAAPTVTKQSKYDDATVIHLQEQLQNMKRELDESEEKNKTLEREYKSLVSVEDVKQTKLSELQQKLSATQDQANIFEDSCIESKTKLASQSIFITELEEKVSSLTQDLTTHQSETGRLKKTIARLEKEMKATSSSSGSSGSSVVPDFEQEYAKLAQLQTELSQANTTINSQRETIESLTLENQDLSSEVQSLKRAVEGSAQSLERHKKSLIEIQNAHHERITAYQSQVTSLQQLTKAERDLTVERRREWEEKQESLLEQVKALEEKSHQLTQQYETEKILADEMTREMQKRLESKTNRVKTLEAEVSLSHETCAEKGMLKKELEMAKSHELSQNIQLDEMVSAFKAFEGSVGNDAEKRYQEIKTLKLEIDTVRTLMTQKSEEQSATEREMVDRVKMYESQLKLLEERCGFLNRIPVGRLDGDGDLKVRTDSMESLETLQDISERDISTQVGASVGPLDHELINLQKLITKNAASMKSRASALRKALEASCQISAATSNPLLVYHVDTEEGRIINEKFKELDDIERHLSCSWNVEFSGKYYNFLLFFSINLIYKY